jgi:hypothetical protein
MQPNPLSDVFDTVAIGAAIGAMANWLPPIAALFAIIWTGIRIYEWFRFRVLKLSTKEEFK